MLKQDVSFIYGCSYTIRYRNVLKRSFHIFATKLQYLHYDYSPEEFSDTGQVFIKKR
jgi:hypothetical protein